MEKTNPTSTKKGISMILIQFAFKICQIPPQSRMRNQLSNLGQRLKPLRAVINVLFPKEELLTYDLTKTAVELTRLVNEVKGYISELSSDFSSQDRGFRTFEYTQMEPQNRFVTEVLMEKRLFLQKYQHCLELFHHDKLTQYQHEKDEAIKYGRGLLKDIKATYNKLPLSVGYVGL